MKKISKLLTLVLLGMVTLTGCNSVEKSDDNFKIDNVQNMPTNNWVIDEDLGENYILLNTATNEQIMQVYDRGKGRFLSAKEAVDILNNQSSR